MRTTAVDLAGTQALILAGGRGERLLPLTASRPKPAIPFGGIFRIIDFTLSNCLDSNLGHVALLTQYRHDDLHRHIREDWSEFWISKQPAQPLICLPPAGGKRYRGTADAVLQNLPVIESNRTEHVLILSGDHVYQMDYRDLLAQHLAKNADVTIATIEHPLKDAAQFGVVEVGENYRVIGFEEKPPNPRPLPLRPHVALVNMGVYVFKKDVLVRALIENCGSAFGYDFGHHVIPSLIAAVRVHAYDFRDEDKDQPRYWRDIGTIDSYHEASIDWAGSKPPFHPVITDSRCSWTDAQEKGKIGGRVCDGARVARSVLSPGVRIEKGAWVEDCVLMPGARVGEGARIRRAIIEEGVRIPADFQVGWNLERDRTRYTISPSGVVVVSETPEIAEPTVTHAVQERTVIGFKPAARRRPVRNVA
jgi:glucose-1-phosphate adenylyltransferase